MTSKWEDRMDFGKYKGKSVKEVFESDPTYLWWAMKNTNRTNFEKEVKNAVEKRKKEIDDEIYLAMSLDWGDLYN